MPFVFFLPFGLSRFIVVQTKKKKQAQKIAKITTILFENRKFAELDAVYKKKNQTLIYIFSSG